MPTTVPSTATPSVSGTQASAPDAPEAPASRDTGVRRADGLMDAHWWNPQTLCEHLRDEPEPVQREVFNRCPQLQQFLGIGHAGDTDFRWGAAASSRRPEDLAAAAVMLDHPSHVRDALKQLEICLEQSHADRRNFDVASEISTQKALVRLLENLHRAPDEETKTRIMNIVFDHAPSGRMADGSDFSEAIDAALKKNDATSVETVSPVRRPDAGRARTLTMLSGRQSTASTGPEDARVDTAAPRDTGRPLSPIDVIATADSEEPASALSPSTRSLQGDGTVSAAGFPARDDALAHRVRPNRASETGTMAVSRTIIPRAQAPAVSEPAHPHRANGEAPAHPLRRPSVPVTPQRSPAPAMPVTQAHAAAADTRINDGFASGDTLPASPISVVPLRTATPTPSITRSAILPLTALADSTHAGGDTVSPTNMTAAPDTGGERHPVEQPLSPLPPGSPPARFATRSPVSGRTLLLNRNRLAQRRQSMTGGQPQPSPAFERTTATRPLDTDDRMDIDTDSVVGDTEMDADFDAAIRNSLATAEAEEGRFRADLQRAIDASRTDAGHASAVEDVKYPFSTAALASALTKRSAIDPTPDNFAQFDALTTEARQHAAFIVDAEMPALHAAEDTGMEISATDREYLAMNRGKRLFEKLYLQQGPFSSIANAGDDGNASTCLILTLLQHATGNYDPDAHKEEGVRMKKQLLENYPDQGDTKLLSADQDNKSFQWLLKEINRRYNTKLDVFEVRPNAKGDPVLADPHEVAEGATPVLIWNYGAHFQGLIDRDESKTPAQRQRSAHALVALLTDKEFA